MKIEFLTPGSPGRQAAEDHIRHVYKDVYGAQVAEFAPFLVSASRANGEVLCAAGIRTASDGFFSDTYLNGGFSAALLAQTGHRVPDREIMEVVSLASKTPFPVLPMLDRMVEWGRLHGMTCGVFTATAPLRKLLQRTGLSYMSLCPADPARLENAASWGRYYETDPWVCAVSETLFRQPALSPRAQTALNTNWKGLGS
jgi:hypothetical protein